MSGHSKWSTIKRDKQANDQARGKVFTKLARSITMAVREGGGVSDPQSNFKLRLAIDLARAANVPKDNIERAIAKASGGGESTTLEEVIYEGFGPGGVGILAEGITDNKNRTIAQVKNVFTREGGSLGASGSVMYLFQKVGEIHILKSPDFSDDQFLEQVVVAGGSDFETIEDRWIVYTLPADLQRIKDALAVPFRVLESTLSFRPTTSVPIPTPQQAALATVVTALEDLDDIHKVYTNAVILHE